MLAELTVLAGIVIILGIVAASIRSSGVWQSALGHPRPPRARGRRPGRRYVRTGASVVCVVIVLGGIAEASLLTRAALRLRKGSVALEQARSVLGASPDDWTRDHVANATLLQQEALSEISIGNDALAGNPLLRIMRKVPGLRGQVDGLLDGTRLALAATNAFGDLLKVAGSVDASRNTQAPAGTRLLDLLSASSGPWADAKSQLDPALAAVAADRQHGMIAPLSDWLDREAAAVQPLADQASLGVVASRFAPAALGSSKPAAYLVLLPNPSEIRPSGGFSGSIGTTLMVGGAPATIDVKNQDEYNPLMKARQPVPTPLARYLKFYKNGLELGDAGWDPDFPTTARLSEAMYGSANGKPIDGTISIDPYALAALLAVTGPVDVAPYGTFTSSNFFSRLNLIVNAETGPGSGKSALAPISRAVLNHLLTAPPSSWPRMFTVMRDQATQRHIQAYFHDTALAEAAAGMHFDGALVSPAADYLMVADANVGATKGDYFVHKSMEIKTEIHPEQGVARHELRVHYDMPLPTDDADRALNPGDGSLREYVRFILPKEAAVAGFSVLGGGGTRAEGGLDSITFPHDLQSVGAFVRVPRGQQVDAVLVYEVPIAPGGRYDLYLQKEAGVAEYPTNLVVSYPGGTAERRVAMTADSEVHVNW